MNLNQAKSEIVKAQRSQIIDEFVVYCQVRNYLAGNDKFKLDEWYREHNNLEDEE